ncbi:uncharacterized protein L969DRAFT_53496 [Mixia osmundae IAM 14324]|uniref:Uncharacterized protein n=1 Tax=Mixia osmundae (strain CBS 9802 / IAM 14324 / JCM 22182 / KY 12970) TaxID=764103 RepID=G7EAZ6_MIXOS|nr:uncharacterized protein L969DRAFT_53496 [Mixia osmundae IAM 14324]KEI37041.1 hypothetical protein L969DRAFT_53496 [Mixia osmundae IAM 14324]GAB00007.1 hypothetical protein E5Q_06709 [Mixia osmundae IAM 14324]
MRFAAVSPFKNAVATPAKKDAWYSELPASAQAGEVESIVASRHYVIARGSSPRTLIALGYEAEAARKYGHAAPTLHLSHDAVALACSLFDNTLAVSSPNGSVSLLQLPDRITEPFAPTKTTSLEQQSTSATCLAFHPHSRGLLLAVHGDRIVIYDTDALRASLSWDAQSKGVWSAVWSSDGRTVAILGKDGQLKIWDPRASITTELHSLKGHEDLVKPCRLIALSGKRFLTTGFSKLRERQISIYDLNLSIEKPSSTKSVDSGTGALCPYVDASRNIVYLLGKGDMTLRQIEILPNSTLSEGLSASLPAVFASACLVPPSASTLALMKAEISRLLLLSTDHVIIPISMTVPRRLYVDFHADLYPAIASQESAQDASDWLSGKDAQVAQVSLHSSSQSPAPTSAKAQDTKHASAPTFTSVSSLTKASATPGMAPAAVLASATPAAGESIARSSPSPASRSAGIANAATVRETAPAQQMPKPFTNPKSAQRWSRAYLSGKAPLLAAYEGLAGVHLTTSPEVPLLQSNRDFFAFPLPGVGGKLAVHALSRTGRLPTHIPAIVAGSTVQGFSFDPFDAHRVFVACEDGKVHSYHIPDEHNEADITIAEFALEDGMDKIVGLHPNPVASHVLLTVSEDRGAYNARVWDLATRSVSISIPLRGPVHSTVWNSSGSKIALAFKDKTLQVLDPRQPDHKAVGPSHDSVRSTRMVFLDDDTLATAGFSRSASREISVHRILDHEIKTVARLSLEVSPAPLFLHCDRDSSILFAYAKGEQTLLAFDVDLSKPSITRLSPFPSSSPTLGIAFLPKVSVDVRRAEIAIALRLTSKTVERVTFTVPRARLEYFQDDIYIPTVDTHSPACTSAQWLAGEAPELPRFDLRPVDMTDLSNAPPTQAQISTRNKIAQGPTLTDSQKSEQQLERIFKMAKDDEGSEDEAPANKLKDNTPDDDDW